MTMNAKTLRLDVKLSKAKIIDILKTELRFVCYLCKLMSRNEIRIFYLNCPGFVRDF